MDFLENRKGSSSDVVLIGILVFILGVMFFVSHFIFNNALNGLLANPTINASVVTSETFTGVKNLTNKFDYVVVGFFIALTLGLLITGWLVGGIPIFMAIYFLVVIIGVLLSGVFSYTWETITTASVFGTTINSFPMTNHLLSNLQIYVSIVGCIGLVVMFGKPYFTDGGIP